MVKIDMMKIILCLAVISSAIFVVGCGSSEDTPSDQKAPAVGSTPAPGTSVAADGAAGGGAPQKANPSEGG